MEKFTGKFAPALASYFIVGG